MSLAVHGSMLMFEFLLLHERSLYLTMSLCLCLPSKEPGWGMSP